MKIKAKIYCQQVTKTAYGSEIVMFQAVYGDGEENKSYAKATPSLQLTMQIDNPEAQGKFEEGKEYFLDFTPSE